MRESFPAAQFVDTRQQTEAAEFGIWIFLSTEILFFGGLFLLYSAYRYNFPIGFSAAARRTDIVIGTSNTAILLTSSFAVAWAVAAVAEGQRRLGTLLLGAAVLLGVAFLGLKGLEYSKEFRAHLVPGIDFASPDPHAAASELFFIFYFIATSLHAVHVIIGIIALAIMAWRVERGDLTARYHNPLMVTGLYWHFVD